MGGGGDTTNITNTGLGDDQYKSLAEGQNTLREDITTGGEALQDTLTEGQTGIQDSINTGFGNIAENQTSLSTDLGAGFKSISEGQTGISDTLGGMQTSLDTGFSTVGEQVGTLASDTGKALSDLGTQATSGFQEVNTGLNQISSDLGGGFSDLNKQYQGLGEQYDNINNQFSGIEDRFSGVGDKLSGLNTRFDTLGTNVAQGQADISNLVGQFGGSLDTYYSDLANKQAQQQAALGQLQTGVAGVQSAYDAGEKAAVQARSQMADQITGGFDQTIDKIATTADAASVARDNMASSIGGSLDSISEGTQQQFSELGSTIQEGYSQQSVQAQQQKIEFANQLGSVRELLQTTGESLNDQTRSNYSQLVDAFDAQGNLIQQSVTETGNTLQRAVDEQGNLVIQEVDQAGSQIASNGLNIQQMLADAETYKNTLSGQIDASADTLSEEATGNAESISNLVNKNYGDTVTRLEGQGDALFERLGAMSSQQDVAFDDLGRKVDANLNDVQTSIQDQQGTIQAGFDQQKAQLGGQITNMATLASGISDLSSDQKVKFSQLGQAFDQQGNLIRNSVDENGNTISRAVDEQGNLILRSFGKQGEILGSNVLNIRNTLFELSQISNRPGGGTFSGQLSPSYTEGVQPANINTGLMSPYAQTRG